MMMRMKVRSMPGSEDIPVSHSHSRTVTTLTRTLMCKVTAKVEAACLFHLHSHLLRVGIVFADVDERAGGRIASEGLCCVTQLRRVALHEEARQTGIPEKHNEIFLKHISWLSVSGLVHT